MKILVVGPSWVGDTIMAQSLFKILKQEFNAIIDVLAPEWSNPVLARMTEVNRSIVMPVGHGKLALGTRYRIGKQLRANNYDRAIVLPNSWKSALIPFWAGIPIRTGWLGELRWGLINDARILDKNKYPKMVQRYIALALPKNSNHKIEILNPKLNVNNENAKQVMSRLGLGFKDKKTLAICAGAAYGPSKCWIVEHFVTVIKQKIKDNWEIWLFGSKGDRAITDKIEQAVDSNGEVKNLAGEINLLETIDLLSKSDAVIANDSGLMHISASIDKPVIAIYGSTTSKFAPPLSNKSTILEQSGLKCRPCYSRTCKFKHFHCMTKTTPDNVLTAIANIN